MVFDWSVVVMSGQIIEEETIHGIFFGVDLHKKVSQLAALRESKPGSQLRFPNDTGTVEKVLKKLPQGSKIALEATGSWWWFVEVAQKTAMTS
jgi:hypothetical protein